MPGLTGSLEVGGLPEDPGEQCAALRGLRAALAAALGLEAGQITMPRLDEVPGSRCVHAGTEPFLTGTLYFRMRERSELEQWCALCRSKFRRCS